MKNQISRIIHKCLPWKLERGQKNRNLSAVESRPNNASEWEEEYITPLKDIDPKNPHPIATILHSLSQDGDLLLETGCGSASISANLAAMDRKIELCDFSEKILDRAKGLFAHNRLAVPHVKCWDLTLKPYPWPDQSVDVTWSSGVLEHWTDDELVPIVKEMKRISKKKVVSFVPYAGSLFYRIGKDYAERNKTWVYGREIPRFSLKSVFEQAGLFNIEEKTVWFEQSIEFLRMINMECYLAAKEWRDANQEAVRSIYGQGYLLLTVGESEK
jgi:ubiquinone/menaquinone biosynthesis C-methylase UbiE